MGRADELRNIDIEAEVAGVACVPLEEKITEEASEIFRSEAMKKLETGTWYQCSGPADDANGGGSGLRPVVGVAAPR